MFEEVRDIPSVLEDPNEEHDVVGFGRSLTLWSTCLYIFPTKHGLVVVCNTARCIRLIAATEAFQALKQKMTQCPVLALPDFNALFELETDASNEGIGAVLMQHQHPIAYYSNKLNPKMQRASTYVKELYAITQAVAKWRQYLLGRHFIIRTDHKSLKDLMEQVIQTPEQHHYLCKLLGYDYTIVYRPGKENNAADALSRITLLQEESSLNQATMCMLALSTLQCSLLDELKTENLLNSEMVKLHQLVAADPQAMADFCVVNGLLLQNGKIRLSSSSALKVKILMEFHASPLGGHSGISKTFLDLLQISFGLI